MNAGGVGKFPALCVLAGLASLVMPIAWPASAGLTNSAARPSVVLIVTDDQRGDSVDQMPQLDSSQEWARFSNAFVDEPQCCPSRASIFTGRYPQNTGVETLRDGADMNEKRTVATMLHQAGYRTAHYGKYLNGYPLGRGLYVPPGWDDFVASVGAGDYYNYTLAENRHTVSYGPEPKDYKTDVLAGMARRFIRSTKESQPFFVYLAFNAPHLDSAGQVVPATQDQGSCAGDAFEQPPNFNSRDTAGEPPWMAAEKPKDVANMRRQRAATCETLHGVDNAITSIVAELEQAGRLSNTFLAVTSDNGYAFGEHRLTGKGDLYEASVRVPLLVRGPDVRPQTIDRLTSNVDLVPTILEWAKVRPPRRFVDGTSFGGTLRGDPGQREPQEVLLRGCRTQRGRDAPCGGYPSDMGFNWGLRTATHKYVEYPDGYVQLFDLTTDPWELTNLASDPGQAQLITDLHARLSRLKGT